MYECKAEWDEQATAPYTIKFYLATPADTTLAGLTSTELEAVDPSPLIGVGWSDGGGGTSVINAVADRCASATSFILMPCCRILVDRPVCTCDATSYNSTRRQLLCYEGGVE